MTTKNMTLLEQVRQLIKSGKISPNKLRGQNFCIDEKVLDDMVSAGGVQTNDNILEIGPGLGFLTEKLNAAAGRVIAVEIEQDFKKVLETKQAFWPKVELLFTDIVRLHNDKILELFKGESYKIVTNLPYSISGVFFRKFLSYSPKPESITTMVQREVGERITAKAGEMSLLALQAQFYSIPSLIKTVKPESFSPKPKVESAIIRLDKIIDWPYKDVAEDKFWQLAHIGFSAKRKTLANNLAAGLRVDREKVEKVLVLAKLDIACRAQELSVQDWHDLCVFLLDKKRKFFHKK